MCQSDDPCNASPCANGGQCLPVFTCDCQDGYAGDTCNQGAKYLLIASSIFFNQNNIYAFIFYAVKII